MADYFVGEIRMFAGGFAPQDWAFCNGALLPISVYETLFTLIGTTYGGDGETTFALPDLSGRLPLHQGNSNGTTFVLGEKAGTETVTLTAQQLPFHSHVPVAGTAPVTASTSNTVFSAWQDSPYSSAQPTVPLNPAVLSPSGGSQPHDNLSPYLGVNFIIALTGVYPTT
ncbi:phage tail protein [Leifsonia sp. NPDC058230]|uniref:phage tail protein n=1 Tax=Leifsonia sp. NPDC058230 TaxID=3346391 RepID=UPI0036DAD571